MNKINTETSAEYTTSKPNLGDSIIEQALAILESRMKKISFIVEDPSYTFTSPEVVTKYLRLKLRSKKHEEFHVLFLNNQEALGLFDIHVLIEAQSMFRGTIDGCSVCPREVAKVALQLNAAAVIFAHNHPSGVSEPSQADRTITSKLKEALGLFDIRVLDHIIVGDTTYSFAEHGLM